MDIEKIKDIIKAGESEKVESKSSFNQSAIISLVAFANASGGAVFLGINDSGQIKGVHQSAESIPQWMNEIRSKTSPSLMVEPDTIQIQDKTIVVFSIQEFPIKPVAVQGKYYQRKKNANHLLSQSEIANYPTMKFDFEEIGDGFYAELNYKEQKTTTRIINVGKDVGKEAMTILQTIAENSHITIPALATELNLSTRTIERHIEKLKKAGHLKRAGGRKTGQWVILK